MQKTYQRVLDKVRARIKPKKTEENHLKKLSQKTLKEIKGARERVKKGEFYTEAEAKKILGL